MTIEALVRGRYHLLPGATAEPIAANAWEVHIPLNADTRRVIRDWSLDGLDDLGLSLDGRDAVQVIGTRASRDELIATALLG